MDNKAAKEDFLKQRKIINQEKSVRTPQTKFNPIKTPKKVATPFPPLKNR